MLSKQKRVVFFLKLLRWVEFFISQSAAEAPRLGKEGSSWMIQPSFRVGDDVVLTAQTSTVRSSQVEADRKKKATGQLQHVHPAYRHSN